GFSLAMCMLPLVLLVPAGLPVMQQAPVVVGALFLAISLTWALSVWLMTPALDVPGGLRRGFGRISRARHTARWLQLGWIVASGAGVVLASSMPMSVAVGRTFMAIAALGVLVGLAGLVFLAVVLRRLAEWCYNDFAQRQLDWAAWGISVCTLGLAGSVAFAPFYFWMCILAVFWLLSLGAFILGLASLTRSILWSLRHAEVRVERITEVRDEMTVEPAAKTPTDGKGDIELAGPE
ncbi:MAG: hypothetical protein ACYTGC_15070, partial [Planctomycetota bacterium]